MEATNNGINPAANGMPQGVAPAATMPPQDVAPAANGPPQGVAPASNAPVNAVAQKKEKAVEEKARREAHLMHLINNTTWQNPNNFTAKENVLKLILGFDPTVFNVDMLHKICGKLGFVSRKFTKMVCFETILKAKASRPTTGTVTLTLQVFGVNC